MANFTNTVITNRQAYDYYRCWLLTRAVIKGENPQGCRYIYNKEERD